MHEMAITESILRLAIHEAERVGAPRITRITLVIGELASVLDDSVSLYFGMLSEGTIAEGAELDFKRLPATLCCQHCGHVFAKSGPRFLCPACGGEGRLTGDAKEFYLESMEVEDAQ
jgi:hydrogenase nickel incorporation protein HypA/HybF